MAKKDNSFFKKLLHRYRLVIVNEDTFEERVSFKINRLSVIVLGGFLSLVLIGFTSLLIVYTPIKSYIPGYTSSSFKKEAANINLKIDSLENSLQAKNAYLENIKLILTGQIDSLYSDIDTVSEVIQNDIDQEIFIASKTDSILRAQVEEEDKFNVLENAAFEGDFTFFPPVKGIVSDTFNIEKKHYAIDIATDKNESVKSIADGRVIFADYTTEAGYVIIIEHKFSIISVYKHNSSLLKSQGQFVSGGEVIALTGSTGDFSTGTHLHFEIWSDGNPLNPEEFINFD
jgi:murein DD-endopeptidase MepM/ murein hydrolase activator NlpD